jgi:hypothetical protein
MNNRARPLSRKELVFYVAVAATVVDAAALVRTYVYPWLGVPVVGVSGLAPFLLAWALVVSVLLTFRSLRRRELLVLLLSLSVAFCVVLPLLWAYGRYIGS